MWKIVEETFNPEKQHHKETVFTIGNGYLSTCGVFEERFPAEMRATFLHGVFDDAPVVFTELANAPDWLELDIFLAGEHFRLNQGTLLSFTRTLDLRTATLTCDLRWRSPRGRETHLVFERFASLADEHLCMVKATITPENYSGRVEVRAGTQRGGGQSQTQTLGLGGTRSPRPRKPGCKLTRVRQRSNCQRR